MRITKLQYRFLFLIPLLLIGLSAAAQDLIIRKNGDRIYCRIVHQDSSSLYYMRQPQKVTFEIKRSDVENFYIASSMRARKRRDTTTAAKHEIVLFEIYGGASIPLGEFSNKDLQNAGAGFARNGALFHTGMIVKLAQAIGFTMAYHYQTNSFATDLFDQQESTLNQPKYPGMSFSTQATNWKVSALFAGFNLSAPFPEVPELSFNIDASMGYAGCTIPELQTAASFMGRTVLVIQQSATKWTPAFRGGLGFLFRIDRNVGINLGFSVLTTKPAFQNLITYSSNGYTSSDNYTQKIVTFNVHLGLTLIPFQ